MEKNDFFDINDLLYASHYCEENAYLVAQKFMKVRNNSLKDENREGYVVFISSTAKYTPIWHQKLGKIDGPVCWDYHVIFIERSKINRPIVYDMDSRLDFPTIAEEYILKSFQPNKSMNPCYRQIFRITPAQYFLDYFASDRSHMIDSGLPQPPWAPLKGLLSSKDMNLFEFIPSQVSTHPMKDNSQEDTHGKVYGLEEFMEWIKS